MGSEEELGAHHLIRKIPIAVRPLVADRADCAAQILRTPIHRNQAGEACFGIITEREHCHRSLRRDRMDLDRARRDPLARLQHVEIVTQLRSEEHTSELQSLMRISYAVFCLKKKSKTKTT